LDWCTEIRRYGFEPARLIIGSANQLATCLVAGLLNLDPEDGGDMFL
jgi:hypothetical protein